MDFSKLFAEKLGLIWHKLYVGVAVALLTFSFCLYTWSNGFAEALLLWDWILATGLCALVLVLWRITNPRIRKKKRHIGICMAIVTESDEEHKKLNHRFIDDFKRKILRNASSVKVDVICLANKESAQIVSHSDAVKTMDRTKCQILMYGKATTGKTDGKPTTQVKIATLVKCPPTSRKNAELLHKEILLGAPREITLDLQNDLSDFELLSTHTDLTARYIIAVAAFLLGGYKVGVELLQSIQSELGTISRKNDSLNFLEGVLPVRIRNFNLHWLRSIYSTYLSTRRTQELLLGDAIADQLLSANPDEYMALLHRSMTHFIRDRDVASATVCLSRCRKIKDSTWMYNQAFLHAYEGDLYAAYLMYRRAFRQAQKSGDKAIQVEEFINEVMEAEANREHLNFALALVNYYAKRDWTLARNAIEKFLALPSAEGAWPEAFAIASRMHRLITNPQAGNKSVSPER